MADEEEAVLEAAAEKKPRAKAPYHYVVREPFGDYRKGHTLTDAEVIAAVHEAGHSNKLIRVRGV